MSVAWPALAALAAAGVAAAWPRMPTAALAVLTAATAAGLRLPALGPAAVALAVAIGLQVPGLWRQARGLHLLALPWLIVAAADTTAPPVGLIADHVAAALGVVLLATAVVHATTRPSLTLALGVALLPWAPADGTLLRWPAQVTLPLDGPAALVQVEGLFGASLATAPSWTASLGPAARVLALLAVAIVWALRQRGRPFRRHGAALLAMAGVLLATSTIIAWQQPQLHVPGQILPFARSSTASPDLTLALLALARLTTLAVLLRPLTGLTLPDAWPRQVALTTACALLALWAVTAAPWHGGRWPGDPAVLATLAVLPAIASTTAKDDIVRDLAALAWLLAAALLVGGAETGWRVAGLLLG